jgi:hypothetical protein
MCEPCDGRVGQVASRAGVFFSLFAVFLVYTLQYPTPLNLF